MPEQKDELTTRVISLYRFLYELNKLKSNVVTDIHNYKWCLSLKDLAGEDPANIKVYEPNDKNNQTILSVHKPEFKPCPTPGDDLVKMLVEGWDDFHREVKLSGTLDDGLKDDYKKWQNKRRSWQKKQVQVEKTRAVFTTLFSVANDLERDYETLEIIAANGILLDRDDPKINHPLILKRITCRFNADDNTIIFADTERLSELYTPIFQADAGLNKECVPHMRKEMLSHNYHPVHASVNEFLTRLTHELSPDSYFSPEGIPEGWEKNNRFLVYNNPMLIVRNRENGTAKAIENIIGAIEKTHHIPVPIQNLVMGGKIETPEVNHKETIDEALANVGGESLDILLSKEANREQLEVAKRIEAYDAVLVQGPPGTGKTHEIANLMGHFLAKGQSVLVTSYTKKALSVLKDQIDPHIQPLCVSVLDDSNEDMEASVDGITDFISRNTSYELKNEMDQLDLERRSTFKDLSKVRKQLFDVISQEYQTIQFENQDVSIADAAAFVYEHHKDLSYIPGRVHLYASLPLSYDELSELYHSNEDLSADDEKQFAHVLPEPQFMLSPNEFAEMANEAHRIDDDFDEIASAKGWQIKNQEFRGVLNVEIRNQKFTLAYPSEEDLNVLIGLINELPDWNRATKAMIIDGKLGGAHLKRWQTLMDALKESHEVSEAFMSDYFGKSYESQEDFIRYEKTYEKVGNILAKKGKIGFFDTLFQRDIKNALQAIRIDGHTIRDRADCDYVRALIRTLKAREKCAGCWNELMPQLGLASFAELDEKNPEMTAYGWIKPMEKYLHWYEDSYPALTNAMRKAHIPLELIKGKSDFMSEKDGMNELVNNIDEVLTPLLKLLKDAVRLSEINKIINDNLDMIGHDSKATLVIDMEEALRFKDSDRYQSAYRRLEMLYSNENIHEKRQSYLKRLAAVAPDWAHDIEAHVGIHGESVVPETIEDAWRWKQYQGILKEILKEPYEELEDQAEALSRTFKQKTAAFAQTSAWYHLLCETEKNIDMKQALQGWKQTVKKIGKGNGKDASMYKAKARELMGQCQKAVPGWIMPIGKALETLDPATNHFDVIIIDEASQADLSSLAVAYMGDKMVIVGDEHQVSPMGVGVDTQKVNNLIQMYLSDVIPNAHLYNAKTSIYDLAMMTYQPLMLREHFRCVPEIIGFSNDLIYEHKIRPLRETHSTNIKPALIPYRVKGERVGKVNEVEAQMIVSLIKSCIREPEYKDKTFGVISLLGDEQAKRIQELIDTQISLKDIERRRILCGNASHFQGDERDVMFLSLVDSPKKEPLPLVSKTVDDVYEKRYNVAASRARDQLWVVTSLDPDKDLKDGDLRKRLITYAMHPRDYNYQVNTAIKYTTFERAIFDELDSRGFDLASWIVGSYQLPLIVTSDNRNVVIACDGDRYHMSDRAIREDMEKQTILERVGWTFIRIRASEYFSKPQATVDQLIKRLSRLGVAPHTKKTVRSNLYQRVQANVIQNIPISRLKVIPKEMVDRMLKDAQMH